MSPPLGHIEKRKDAWDYKHFVPPELISKAPLASTSGFRLNLLRLADYKSERLTMSKRIRSERSHLARIERAARTNRKGLRDSGVRFLLAVPVAAALFIATFEPSASSSSAQPQRPAAQQNQTTATAARNAALIGATQAVLKETSAIRQL